MIIERTNNEILLRLPANMDTDVLQKIINFLKYKEATKKSLATEKEVNSLADESKKNWWKENKGKYIK
jgi:dimeric dUTPase (all-alpha-NTP-PPase superfamily)